MRQGFPPSASVQRGFGPTRRNPVEIVGEGGCTDVAGVLESTSDTAGEHRMVALNAAPEIRVVLGPLGAVGDLAGDQVRQAE